MTSTRSARRFFTRPYAATGRASRTAPCSPRIPESGPSSRRAARPRAISSSRGRPTTASRASSICSASSLRASPRRSRSETRYSSFSAIDARTGGLTNFAARPSEEEIMDIRTLVAAALALATSQGLAQTKWDMPTPYPDGNFHTKNIRQFADEVGRATRGGLQIQVHSNGALIKHPEIKRAVQTGQVPIGELLISVVATESPLFAFDSNPFVANSYPKETKMWRIARPYLEKRLDDHLGRDGRGHPGVGLLVPLLRHAGVLAPEHGGGEQERVEQVELRRSKGRPRCRPGGRDAWLEDERSGERRLRQDHGFARNQDHEALREAHRRIRDDRQANGR